MEGLQASSMFAAGGGARARVALNRASGEWSPSQHFCSGFCGLGEGADSWQPESVGAASGVAPIVQEACNSRAAIATNMATRPLSRNINPNTFITPLEAVFNFTAFAGKYSYPNNAASPVAGSCLSRPGKSL
jgi:hypothetical protein